VRQCLMLFTLGVAALLVIQPEAQSQVKKKAKTPIYSDQKDAYGDLLPIGAAARIGSLRYRLNDDAQANHLALSPDGKWLAFFSTRDSIDVWQLPAWTKHCTFDRKSFEKKKPVQFQSVAFTHDSKQVVTYETQSHQVLFFDLEKNAIAKRITFPQKQQPYQDLWLMLDRDGKSLVATFMADGENRQTRGFLVWDLDKDKLVRSFSIDANPSFARPHLAISPDTRWAAQTTTMENPANRRQGTSSFVEIWDLHAGKSVHKIETETAMQLMAFSPDGKSLAAFLNHSVLSIFDTATGKEQHHVRMRRSRFSHIAYAPDGKNIYLADEAGHVIRWNADKGEAGSWKAPFTCPVRHFAFTAGGNVLALGAGMDSLFYWDVVSGKALSPAGVPASIIVGLGFAPNGDLFVADEEGYASWWNPRTGAKLRDQPLEDLESGSLFSGGPRRGFDLFEISQDGAVIAASDGGAMSFHDVKSGKLLYDDDARSGMRGALCFFDQGKMAAGIQFKKVRLWNSRTGRDVASFDVPLQDQEQAQKIAVTENGTHIAVSTRSDVNQHRVLLVDRATKKLMREWNTAEPIEAMKFSPDARWLALAGRQDRVQLHRVGARASFEMQINDENLDISQIAFSPDGRCLACAVIMPTASARDRGKVLIFEVASKKVRLELVGHPTGIIERLAYAPDSGLLASGATDTTALVWNAGLRALAAAPADKDASDEDLASWFAAMGGNDAKAAFNDMIKLARTRHQAVKLLDAKIAPPRKADPGEKAIPEWVQDLSSGQFVVRARATDMLRKLGPAAEADLRAALQKAVDVETRRRLEELLDRITAQDWTPHEVLHARAVEVLDAIPTPEARAVLTRWAAGDAGAVLTQEAARALKK